MERNQFTFYRSYYEAVKELPKKEQCAVMLAICAYALEEKEPELTGTAKAIFSLVRPTLDASRRKAINGKSGGGRKQNGSKTEANEKQTASKKENEKEDKNKKENECYNPLTPAAIVQADFLNRINPTPSPSSLDALAHYAEQMGVDVCKRAFDIALDNKKTSWSYIRAILENKLSRGVKCLADWDELDEKRRKEQEDGTANQPGSGAGNRSNDWLQAVDLG